MTTSATIKMNAIKKTGVNKNGFILGVEKAEFITDILFSKNALKTEVASYRILGSQTIIVDKRQKLGIN